MAERLGDLIVGAGAYEEAGAPRYSRMNLRGFSGTPFTRTS